MCHEILIGKWKRKKKIAKKKKWVKVGSMALWLSFRLHKGGRHGVSGRATGGHVARIQGVVGSGRESLRRSAGNQPSQSGPPSKDLLSSLDTVTIDLLNIECAESILFETNGGAGGVGCRLCISGGLRC